MLDHTEEQPVLANLEPGQILLFCEDLQEIEKYMLQQTFLMDYLWASLSLSPSPSPSPHLSLFPEVLLIPPEKLLAAQLFTAPITALHLYTVFYPTTICIRF